MQADCACAAQLLLGSIDIDASGTIDYEEFLAATVNLSQLEKEENMYRAFAHFDTDNSGYITEDELEAALKARPRFLQKMTDQHPRARIEICLQFVFAWTKWPVEGAAP